MSTCTVCNREIDEKVRGGAFEGKHVWCLKQDDWDRLDRAREVKVVEQYTGKWGDFPYGLRFRVTLSRGARFLHENEPDYTTIENMEILNADGDWVALYYWCLKNRSAAVQASRMQQGYIQALAKKDEKIAELRQELRKAKTALRGFDKKINSHRHELFMEMVRASKLKESYNGSADREQQRPDGDDNTGAQARVEGVSAIAAR